MTAKATDPNNAGRKPSTRSPSPRLPTNQNSPALTKTRKSPNVRQLSGHARNPANGPKTWFATVKTATETKADGGLSTARPETPNAFAA